MITLFDIPSVPPNRPWSPNTWRTRFCLNYKGLPYKTEWVEYPDIATVYAKYNMPAPSTNDDGSPYYSLPAIIDDRSGQPSMITGSRNIAQHLDETYPDTPLIFPEPGEEGMNRQAFWAKEDRVVPLYPLIWKQVMKKLLSPRSQAHFTVARGKDLREWYGGQVETLEDVQISDEEKAEKWKKFKSNFELFGEETFGGKEGFRWYLGDKISWIDFVVAGILIWIRESWGDDSEEWKDVITWNDGKWLHLLEGLKEYQAVL
ncbi:hypothetical protein BKA70DRAFT_12145 [Coprinopsis sp. MPI-PUGE-AT-0042]|nr:hypothetical protein BKA70DRAFT_12145 [Coprinopsis sp. MPI-PUGE-AT-0042]